MSLTTDNHMELSEDLEEGDDDFYFEVEEIVQMHVTENGVRMFEIKWKNYDSSSNTWEPEHNLNCPSILKAFLEKNGYSEKPEKKKRKKKTAKAPVVESPPVVVPDIDEAEFFKDDEVEISAVGANKRDTTQPKKKKRKTSKEQDTSSVHKSSGEKSKNVEKNKSNASMEDNIRNVTRGLDEARVAERDAIKEKVDSTTKKVVEDIGKKAVETKKSGVDVGSDPEGSKKRVEESARIPLMISKDRLANKPTPTPKQNVNDGSFTALKRGTATKPPTTSLTRILESMAGNQSQQQQQQLQHNFRTQVNPRKPYESNNQFTSNKNNTTPSTNSNPLQPTSIPKQVHLPPSQPSPSSPKIPSLPPPSTPSPSPPHIPQHLANKTSPVLPPKTPVDWQNKDPRIRSRFPSTNQSPTLVHQSLPQLSNRPPPPAQYDQYPIKRQLSNSKDPRMRPDNQRKRDTWNKTSIPTPFGMSVVLYNGSKFVATASLEGKQTCFHEVKVKALLAAISSSKNEVRISSTIPLKALNAVLKDRPVSFMSLTPVDRIVDVSKLKSYYQVNEMAGVLHHPSLAQAIIVLAEADLKKLSNVVRESLDLTLYSPLTVLFIEELTPRPKFLDDDIQYEYDSNDNNTPFAWQRVTKYLRFPDQLIKQSLKARFLVYGHSDTATMLTKASNLVKPAQQPPPSYVMMFDRYNETIFSRNLTKHKKEPSTQIWEFGVSNFAEGKMVPAMQVFPNNSGGFVTTDMENIVHNPSIITEISAQVAKFNSMPSMYGEWKFILPYHWVQQAKKLVKDAENAQRVKEAVIAITVALSNDSISILKLWSTEEEEPTCIQYLDRVAHEKYTTHQHFVYIDDITSVPTDEHIHSIDFVQSSKLFSTFA